MKLFSVRKFRRIYPRLCGLGPPAAAHGSTNFIKRRLLASWSTAQIEPSESISRLLISAVHHRSDGWGGWLRPGAARARARDGASRPSAVAHRSSSFLELRWLVFNEFAPTGSQRRGERDHDSLNRRRAETEPGYGEAARSVLGDGEGGLWWRFGSKDVRQGFLELPSSFSTDQLLWTAENSNLAAT
jgi:hypothetical protein